MGFSRFKSLLVAVFSAFFTADSTPVFAQHRMKGIIMKRQSKKVMRQKKKEGFNASEVIFGHVLNAHEFHFLDIGDHPVTIPLPVILYSPQRGFTTFMSSSFEHGHKTHKGYALLTEHSIT